MECTKLNGIYIVHAPVRTVWKYFFLAALVSTFSVALSSAAIAYLALRSNVQQTIDLRRENESLTYEARKWAVEAGKCAQKIITDAERKKANRRRQSSP
jgi:hypothetical protein